MVDVAFERQGRIAVVTLSGEVDMSNATSVRQRIADSVTPDDTALVVDLAPLSFIDSAGLHALIELGTVLDEKRQRLVLCVPPDDPIARVIEIVGMPRTVSVRPDLDSAIGAAENEADPGAASPGGDR
jgi:anti-sigma B factor antagonist